MMSIFRFNPVLIVLLGSTIALVSVEAATALNAAQVKQIAEGITVLIDGINPGSGVIIAREGRTYYVLTARHVVATQDEYTIVTGTGDRYPLDYRTVLPLPGIDLAVLSFSSAQSYPVATLANYSYNASFQNVFTAGWTASPQNRTNRVRQFTAGVLGNRDFSLAMIQSAQRQGYDLFYSNLTEVGMSGGPVLDLGGRVIGIHGQADGEEINDPSRGGTVRVKRGFSSGIPISTFLDRLSQTGLRLALRVENSLPATVTPQQANSIQAFVNPTPQPDSNDAVDWTNQGNQLYRAGRFQASLDAFNRAVQLQPDFYPAWYERGNVLFAMNLLVEALASYDQAIQLKSDYHIAWRDRGVLLLQLNQPIAALGSFDRSLALKADDYVLWYMRGNLLTRDLQDYNAALSSYDRSLQIKPDFAPALTGRGKALYELRQFDAALSSLERAIQIEPNLVVAWILKGKTLAAKQRRPDAIAALEQALRLRPSDPAVLQLLTQLKQE